MKKGFVNFWKRKFLLVFAADVVFFSLLLWFLVYARNRIFSYLLVVQQFAPKLTDIGSTLAADDPAAIARLDLLLKVIEPIVREANLFVYFIIPVILFFLWVLFQGMSWNLLKENSMKKVLDIRFYSKFALLSIPVSAVFFYLFSDFPNLAENVNLTKSVVVWVILVVVLYFTIISYLVVNRGKFLQNFFRLSLRKVLVFFPLFILFLIMLLLVLVLFFNAYISALSLVVPSALSILPLLFFILLFSSSKCLLAYLSE